MLDGKLFISKLLSVDALTSSSIELSEVTSLGHEVLYNSMENRVAEKEILARLATTGLTSAKLAEVLSCARNDVLKKFHDNGALCYATNADVKVDARILNRGVLLCRHLIQFLFTNTPNRI